jgi:hypothetical protein
VTFGLLSLASSIHVICEWQNFILLCGCVKFHCV